MQRRIRVLCLLTVSAALAYAAFPRVTSVEPDMAKPGDEATAVGSALGEVAKLFLTAAGKDTEVEIKGQTAEEIKFAVPADLPHGSYKLTIQTGGVNAAILEQPILLEVADAAAIEARKKELEEPPPAEEPAPTPPTAGKPQ